jgi:hypothetical protein
MSNPWLKKNPWLSLWLSGANRVANTARGHVTSEARRQTASATNRAIDDVFDFWTAALTPAKRPRKRKH